MIIKLLSKFSTFRVFSQRVNKYKGQLIVTRKNWHLNQLSEERWHSEIHGKRRARSGVELLSGMVKRESIKQRLQFKDTKGWWGQGQKRQNRTSHAIDWKQFLRVASVLQPQPSSVYTTQPTDLFNIANRLYHGNIHTTVISTSPEIHPTSSPYSSTKILPRYRKHEWGLVP